ncbi:hypothetical protein WA158_003144 [Blastocystis sp. Blastoise]
MSHTDEITVDVKDVAERKSNPFVLLFIAGILSSLGACFAKLSSVEAKTVTSVLSQIISIPLWSNSTFLSILQVISFVINILLSSLSMTFYVKSMGIIGSLTATVISTGLNFVLSGIAGWFIYNEKLTLTWLSGGAIMLIGISFVVFDQDQSLHSPKC